VRERKLKKPTRIALVNRLVQLARLSPGATTLGYLSRVQLLELVTLFERWNDGGEKATARGANGTRTASR